MKMSCDQLLGVLSIIAQTIGVAFATVVAVTVYRLERLAKKYEIIWAENKDNLMKFMIHLLKRKDIEFSDADEFNSKWEDYTNKYALTDNKKYSRAIRMSYLINRYIRWGKRVRRGFMFTFICFILSLGVTIFIMIYTNLAQYLLCFLIVLYILTFVITMIYGYIMFNDSFIDQRSKIMCEEINHNQKKDNGEYIALAYQTTLEDLKFFKKQQWYIAYYCMAIYYGIIWLWHNKYIGNKCLLLSLIIVIMLIAISLIFQFHSSITGVRSRKDRIRDKIPQEIELMLFGCKNNEKDCKIRTSLDKYSVTILLSLIILIGAMVAIYSIGQQ